ncbi:MAG: amidase [Rhodospirillaceae bacterium]|nr:amidase [Rhodospirillaceae bacterium]|tara:strand:- start:633 stop:1973 length:1341 start_codon:yes stop_codon:yes gene_type:complete
MNLIEFSALEARNKLMNGEISAYDLTHAYLDQISDIDEDINAWSFLDHRHALNQARAADETRAQGMPVGALFGLPVAVKDIFDTYDMPTECGTSVYSGRKPAHDSTVAALLRQAGAIIIGKSVTTELAMYGPGKTRNPHDKSRTPGGSSSGSAAVVAAKMAPLAVGSQTNGSIIRPASFCGVVGYKPSHGLISRSGSLILSSPLDTVGVFGKTVTDVALIGDALAFFDSSDNCMSPKACPNLLEHMNNGISIDPTFAFVKSPAWNKGHNDLKAGFNELTEELGDLCEEVGLPDIFTQGAKLHRTIMIADVARNLGPLYDKNKNDINSELCQMIEEGRNVKAIDYNNAIELREVLNAGLDQIFERYDAIITPSTTGEAPKTLEYTGNPVFCSLWTFCGVPAITLPLLIGDNSMPIGVQMIGQRGYDARLLRNAQFLSSHLARCMDAT